MLMMLPEELIMLVQKNVKDYTSLSNLKISCTYFNKSVTQFSLTREVIRKKIDVYNKRHYSYKKCANINCYDDIGEFYIDYDIGNYHIKGIIFNTAAIRINKKFYNHKYYRACSPYCNTCFFKYVLIGENTNARHEYDRNEHEMNIYY